VAGTAYVVTVRNDRDCLQASPAITITEPDPLTATALQQQTLHVALLP
jgi:hypothetical protein